MRINGVKFDDEERSTVSRDSRTTSRKVSRNRVAQRRATSRYCYTHETARMILEFLYTVQDASRAEIGAAVGLVKSAHLTSIIEGLVSEGYVIKSQAKGPGNSVMYLYAANS